MKRIERNATLYSLFLSPPQPIYFLTIAYGFVGSLPLQQYDLQVHREQHHIHQALMGAVLALRMFVAIRLGQLF